jgi:hypothetical protein
MLLIHVKRCLFRRALARASAEIDRELQLAVGWLCAAGLTSTEATDLVHELRTLARKGARTATAMDGEAP